MLLKLQHTSNVTSLAGRLTAIEQWVATAASVGVDTATLIPDVLAKLATAQQVAARQAHQAPDLDQLKARLSAELLAGTVELDAALDQIVEADRLHARGSAGADFLASLTDTARLQVWFALAAYDSRLISSVLRPAHDVTVQTIRQLGDELVDVADARDAMRRRLGDRWQDAEETFIRWQTLHALAEAVRGVGFDNSAPGIRPSRHFDPEELRYQQPLKLPERMATSGVAPWRRLYASLAAEPAMLTAAEALANRERDERRAAAKQRQQQGPPTLGSGLEIDSSQIREMVEAQR